MAKGKRTSTVVSAVTALEELLDAEVKPYGRVQVWSEAEIESLNTVVEWILEGKTSRNKFVKYYAALIDKGLSFDNVDPKKTKSAVDRKIRELLQEYEEE